MDNRRNTLCFPAGVDLLWGLSKVKGYNFPWGKSTWREADQSRLSCVKVKDEWSYKHYKILKTK